MSLIIVGTSYKYSHPRLRERIFFSKSRLRDALSLLKKRGVLKGAVILSTCNRVEIYASAEEDSGREELEDFISIYHEIDKRKFSPYLYIYRGMQAIKHLLSVTSGIDSLIVGETQILGQVRFSFFESEKAEFVDGFLTKIFSFAIAFGGKVHHETAISEGKISVGSVAIDFIRDKVGHLSEKNILILGMGKVTELVLKYLRKENLKVTFVSNRTFDRAEELAREIGATAVRFDDLPRFLKQADIVITATASPHFIIKKEMIEDCLNRRLLIVDLALPRDVDPRVKEMENVALFYLEDLNTVIRKNMENKIREAEKIKGIIDIEAQRLWSELTKSEPEPALSP